MLRYGRIATGLAAVALLGSVVAAAPAAASVTPLATSVLTYGSVGGTNVAVGDVLQASLRAGTKATFYNSTSGSTGVSCATSSFRAEVTSNPTAPGTATERLTDQRFSDCTTNVIGTLGVNSVTVDNLAYAASVSSSGVVTITGSSTGPIQSTVSLRTLLGNITCVYRSASGSITGTASNATTSITFTNQPFTKVSGPATCFGTAYFSASYGPVLDTSVAGSPITYVN